MQKEKVVSKTPVSEQRKEFIVLGNEIEQELEEVKGFRSYLGPIPIEVDEAKKVRIKARLSDDLFQPKELADI